MTPEEKRWIQIGEEIEYHFERQNKLRDERDEINEKIRAKGNWESYVSSGYLGYRCKDCLTFRYPKSLMKCNCNKVVDTPEKSD